MWRRSAPSRACRDRRAAGRPADRVAGQDARPRRWCGTASSPARAGSRAATSPMKLSDQARRGRRSGAHCASTIARSARANSLGPNSSTPVRISRPWISGQRICGQIGKRRAGRAEIDVAGQLVIDHQAAAQQQHRKPQRRGEIGEDAHAEMQPAHPVQAASRRSAAHAAGCPAPSGGRARRSRAGWSAPPRSCRAARAASSSTSRRAADRPPRRSHGSGSRRRAAAGRDSTGRRQQSAKAETRRMALWP